MLKLFIFFIFTSCASKGIQVGSNTGYSPESQGELFKGTFIAGAEKNQEMILNDSNEFTFEESGFGTNVLDGIHLGLALGLHDRVDFISFTPMLGTTPLFNGIKLQLLGENSQKAKKENLSVSVLLGIGSGQNGGSSVENDYVTSQRNLFEFHLAIGYRDTDFSLYYLNINRGSEKIQGEQFEQGEETGFEFEEVVAIQGFSLGRIIELNEHSLFFEYFLKTYQWPNQANISMSGLSLKLARRW